MSSSRSRSAGDSETAGDGDQERVPNISSTDVSDKYKTAAQITNETIRLVVAKCIDGASVVDVCQFGDNTIFQKTSDFAKKASFKKGIAFPTCLSINGYLAHVSPLRANDFKLKSGDLVKIELGAHIDGYIAISAQTLVIGATKENPATGRKADVILAAYYAAEAASRAVKVGTPGQQVADVVDKAAQEFDCTPVENMLFYAMTQNKVEGEDSILINGTHEAKKDHAQPEVKEHDVYGVDVLVSSGKGPARATEMETTVYKLEDVHYSLKSKRSRHFFTYSNNQFGLLPFNVRYFECDENTPIYLPKLKTKDNKNMDVPDFVTAKMGVKESREHGLVSPFDVNQVEEGEFVAQFKFTVFVHAKGPERITSIDFDPSAYKSEHNIKDDSIKNLLKEKVDAGKKKKKKKAAGKATQNGEAVTVQS